MKDTAGPNKRDEWGQWVEVPFANEESRTIMQLGADAVKVVRNNLYQVVIRTYPDIIHLSITDNALRRDWRHYQRIKNELVGKNREAVELYPAEERCVDNANQFHLWVLRRGRFPLGFPMKPTAHDFEVARAMGLLDRITQRPRENCK